MKRQELDSPRRFCRRFLDALLLRGDVDSIASVSLRQLFSSSVATLVDITVFYALTRMEVVGILVSAALGFCCGLVVNFAITSCYVFRHRAAGRFMRADRFLRYVLLGTTSLCLNHAIIWFLSVYLSFHPLIGKLTSVVTVFFWNQWIARRFIFINEIAEPNPPPE